MKSLKCKFGWHKWTGFILIFAAFCFAKDSVSVNVTSSTGILQTKILYYDADKLLQLWSYIPTVGVINPIIPQEMMQYVIKDTTMKNMPPFIGGKLTITRKDLGKDTVSLDIVNARVNAILKTRVLVK